MKLHPRVSADLVSLVKRFEPMQPSAVAAPQGGWTIGYGHTRTAREGAAVSQADADALLLYDLSETAIAVDALVTAPLNANQFDALVAFVFNIGLDNFRQSSALQRLNAGDDLLAAQALERWRKARLEGEDVVVDALVRRRAVEKAHFLTPAEGFARISSPLMRPQFDAAEALAPPIADHVEGQGSATLAAVNGVAERLRTLVPEPLDAAPVVEGREPALPPESPAELAKAADPAPQAPGVAEPAEAPSPLVDPDAPPPPFVAAADLAPSSPADEAQPKPEPAQGPSLPSPPAVRAAFPRLVAPERAAEPAVAAKPGPPASAQEAPAGGVAQARAFLSLGLVGAVLFVGAVASILAARPGVLNLAVGLIGVICMVPAAYTLIGPTGPAPPQD